jgi:hypothetical protein
MPVLHNKACACDVECPVEDPIHSGVTSAVDQLQLL